MQDYFLSDFAPYAFRFRGMSPITRFQQLGYLQYDYRLDTEVIVSPSVRPLGSLKNATLVMSTKHLSSRTDAFSAKQHTTVQVHSHNTSVSLFSACWERYNAFSFLAQVLLQKSGIVAGNRVHISLSLSQTYQLCGRWSRDDLSPADWQHTMHFPGTFLRASCFVTPASRVLAQLQAPSTPAFMLVQNRLQNVLR